MVVISTLIPNPKNPRIIKDANFKKLVKSIKEFPKMMEMRPIIIDENNHVLGGNMRLAACKELNMLEIPDSWVKQYTDLTDEEKKEFLVKDNLQYGDWDWTALTGNWDMEELKSWSLDVPEKPKEKPIVEDDYLMGGKIETDIKPGDLFEIDRHRLFCADNRIIDNLVILMETNIASLVFNHPDANGIFNDLQASFDNADNMSTGISFWVLDDRQAAQLAYMNEAKFHHFFFQDYRIAPAISSNKPRIRHNTIAMFGNMKMNNLKDGFSTVLEIPTTGTTKGNKKLPQAKRIDLPAAFIKHYSNEDDIVLDMFGHSGSTLMACQQLNRICYIMDIEPQYCYAMLDRYLRAFPNANIKKNGLKYLHK